jgi:hypothetical protein
MSDYKSPARHYRRLARECLEVAYTFPAGEQRTALLQMAQVWLRLADEYADATVSVRPTIERERPAMQQQQQIQPKKDDKKE